MFIEFFKKIRKYGDKFFNFMKMLVKSFNKFLNIMKSIRSANIYI